MSAPAARPVALICTGDDPDLPERLRAATWRGIRPTVFVRAGDARGRRLALAAGADLGSIGPDGGTAGVLGDGQIAVGGRVVAVVDDLEATTDGPTAIALRRWDGALIDALTDRGWRPGPLTGAAQPAPGRLDGVRALHVTSVHRPDDGRIFHREVAALRAAGADATVLGFDPRPARRDRLAAGWRLVGAAGRRQPDVVHVHDPELLPAAWMLRRRSGCRVVYDAHEYLGQTTRTKPWIPGPLRLPAALTVERVERGLARGLDAVVTVTEDMALEFAERGIDAISVANFASRGRFPEPSDPEPGLVVYVGALDRSRGLDLMLEAFPMVDHSGARLLLAGPGHPGPLPPRVEHVGPVAYDDVPAVLNRAEVIWMPLRRTPNNDRGRLTKVMEAMASGRPLVASDLVRTSAIVRQAGCGLIVPADDPGAHATALTALLRDPGRAAEMGAAGRRAFLETMTFEGEAEKLVALYARLTGRAEAA